MSPKVVRHMKKVDDKAALPRCDACCRMCKSLCIEAANHDIQDRPHDTIHQPGGVAGQSYMHTDELVHRTCHQCYQEDRTFQRMDGWIIQLMERSSHQRKLAIVRIHFNNLQQRNCQKIQRETFDANPLKLLFKNSFLHEGTTEKGNCGTFCRIIKFSKFQIGFHNQ